MVLVRLGHLQALPPMLRHGQGGYLGECIQGERTALRQAVLRTGHR